jgi:hypothetical protein
MPDIVKRIDRLEYRGSFTKTDEGYLDVRAPIAVCDVYEYLTPDGKIQRELVHADTLFDEISLDTIKLKPVTNSHPPETFVNPELTKERQIGTVGETLERRHDMLYARMVINTDEGIREVMENGKRELSPGYTCELVHKPGVFNGKPYDFIQTNRKYNHVAICDKARGGSDLAIKIDSSENYATSKEVIKIDEAMTSKERTELPDSSFAFVKMVDGKKVRKFPYLTKEGKPDLPRVRNALARLNQSDLTPKEKQMVFNKISKIAEKAGIEVQEQKFDAIDNNINNVNQGGVNMPTIRIDGVDHEAASEVITHLGRLEEKVTQAETKADSLEKSNKDFENKLDEKSKEFSKLEAERDELKEKLDAIEGRDFEAEIKARVQERVKVEAIAKNLDVKIDSDDIIEIKKAIIKKQYPKANLDGKDETYINARFDGVDEELQDKEEHKTDEHYARTNPKYGEKKLDEDEEAEKRYLEASRNAHKREGK